MSTAMSLGLSERYRPGTLGEVVGQPVAVEWCLTSLKSGNPKSVLFYGPSGCGKTSLARIYAQACACENPSANGLACGDCPACHTKITGSRTDFYAEINCVKATVEEILEHIASLKHSPLTGSRRIIVFDEAHGLTRKQSDSLLQILERPTSDFVIILLTSEFGKLERSLYRRVSKQRITGVTKSDLVAHAQSICAAEGFEYEPAALDLVIQCTGGYVRDMIQTIEDTVVRWKVLTEENVRRELELDVEPELAIIASILKGNLASAEQALKASSRPPAELAETVRELLTALEYRVRNIMILEPMLQPITSSTWDDLMGSAQRCADARKVDTLQILAELSTLWSRASIATLQELRRAVLDSQRWLYEQRYGGRRERQALLRRTNKTTSRPHRRVRNADSKGCLSLNEIVKIWDAASLMTQVYGTCFNSRLTLRPTIMGLGNDAAAINLFRYARRSLIDRVQEWSAGAASVHWAYSAIPSAAGPALVAAFAIPPSLVKDCGTWLHENFCRNRFSSLPSGGLSWRYISSDDPRSIEAYHRNLVRLLCRSVQAGVKVKVDGSWQDLAEVLKLRDSICDQAANRCVARVSKTIGRSAADHWVGMGLSVLTPARDGAWTYRNPGWELSEHCEREAILEAARCSKAAPTPLEAVDIARVHPFSRDAKVRPRGWTTPEKPGWWQPAYTRR